MKESENLNSDIYLINKYLSGNLTKEELEVFNQRISNEEFVVNNGERIAQMVIARHEQAEWIEVEELAETERGAGGFGSTGTK